LREDRERQARFAQLVREQGRAMFRAARSIADCDADAEDAVGEAICRAWRSYDTLRDPAAGRAWLLRIVVNCAYELYRREVKVVPMEALLQEPPAPQRDLDLAYDLWSAVQRLPIERRTAVVLFYYEDMSIEEIARTLDVPVGTVKSRLSRGREQLRQLLGEEETV